MKKILCFITLAVTINVMYAQDYSARITMKLSSVNGAQDKIDFYESSEFSSDFDNGADGVKTAMNTEMMGAFDNAVDFFAACSFGNATAVAASSLEGTKLTLISNKIAGDVYTITFSKATGIQYYLKDNMVKGVDGNDSLTAIVAGETYSFTQAVSTTEERFEIVTEAAPEADYTRDVTSGNWYTICLPYASSSFTGMDLYTVAGYNAQEGFGVDPVAGQMVAGMPYIFQATAATIEVFYTGEPVNAPVDGANYLVGTFTGTTTPAQAYVVANNMLNWVANATVPENRAYLNYADITDGNFPVANSNAPGRKFIAAPKGITTDLNQLTDSPVGRFNKYIIDGQFVIMKDGQKYNVLGM